MNNFSLRIYMILCLLLTQLRLWAQEEGGDLPMDRGGRDAFSLDMDDISTTNAFHLRFSDIVIVALLLIGCYVFGKIWKGCIYMLLAFAALMYFVSH